MEHFTPRASAPRSAALHELEAMVQRVQRHGVTGRADRVVQTDLPQPLDQLQCGVLHEWLCGDETEDAGRPWMAPILVFAHLVQAAVGRETADNRLLVWIGRRLWPQPHVLAGRAAPSGASRQNLLKHSLLVDPATLDDRLWAIDLCLRSEAVAAVMADASEMRMAHSRRLQLAAEAGGALALLARPAHERSEHSAAAMRWRIQPTPSPTSLPRWRIDLVRCKGAQRRHGMDAASGSASTIVLEHDHAAHCLRPPADVAHRSCAAETATRAARRTG